MQRSFVLTLLLILFYACDRMESTYKDLLADVERITLPNGWSLSPVGASLPLGDLPLNLAVSPDEKYAVVTNNGQSTQSLMLIDLETDEVLDTVEVEKAWLGLAISSDGKTVYASGGNDNQILIFDIANGRLLEKEPLVLGEPWPRLKISPAGLALDEERDLLYTVTKEDSALYVLDLVERKVKERLPLGHEAYTCGLSPAGNELYISLWGGSAVAVYDPQAGRVVRQIRTGSHPNDLYFHPDGRRLFVACANDNSVSVIDVEQGRVIETIATALYPDAPAGSTSNGLAVSPDGEFLFIANADNNCLAVFEVEEYGESRSLGFIPTGWYPTDVEVANGRLLVCNGKGFISKPNPKGPVPGELRTEETQHIGGLFWGTLSMIELPDADLLGNYTQMVYANTPYSKEIEQKAPGEVGNPIPMTTDGQSPIKYVFYVIKENRTYDQVLGDLPQGDGDPSLCLFPDSITPNHHALAREFVLLDNFYVNAEVSADGHNWSMGAYANDYVEKTWPTSYGGRGGTYDYEGSRKIAYPDKGFIWDNCKREGVSYRTYGEFANLNQTHLETLKGHHCTYYPGYDLRIRDVYRFEKWKQEFDSLLASNAVPQFNTVRFGNDHTAGARQGYPTPRAMVADNDLAVGRFVEHLSNSPIWKESVVFIMEDDAQNGPDHVDAHRSVLLIASPYTKRGHLERTLYTTTSVLRTIELILGLPPMSQYDAAATPLYACFTPEPDPTPYRARPNGVDLNEMNAEDNRLSRLSYNLNLDKEDQAPDHLFSEIIWKTIRGEDSEMPAPRRAAFIRTFEEED